MGKTKKVTVTNNDRRNKTESGKPFYFDIRN